VCLVGGGGGGEIEVVPQLAEQGVADGTADQEDLVSGLGEQATQIVDDGRNAQELAHRVGLGFGQTGHEARF